MAKKVTLTATLPDGTTATRTTARTYTHLVAGRRSYEHALALANATSGRVQDGKNWDWDAACAAGTYEYPRQYSEADKVERQAKAAKFIAANPDRAAYVARKHSEWVARVEAEREAGAFDSWGAITWCGRPDLAAKALATEGKSAWWAETRIVAVNA